MSQVAENEYLTITEAAKLAGVSRMKLYQLVHEGTLPTYLTPLNYRRRYVKRRDVLRLKETRPANTNGKESR